MLCKTVRLPASGKKRPNHFSHLNSLEMNFTRILFALTLILLNLPVAHAQTWTGATSTDWHTPTNWAPAVVPTASDDVKIPNMSNDPVIGATAFAKTVHVQINGSLTIQAGLSLTINGSFSDGGFTQAMKNQGTVNNNGTLTIGSTTSPGGLGLLNDGTFNNNMSGKIAIDRSTALGLFNRLGMFTNAGEITIGADASPGERGLENQATFHNIAGGKIDINNSTDTGLANGLETFTNAGKITIGADASPGIKGLENQATFHNNAGGEIAIDRSTTVGLFNAIGTFTNAGEITIGAVASPGTRGIENQATLHNNACGTIYTTARLFNSSGKTITNAGLFTLNTASAHTNSGTFTNTGIIKYAQSTIIPGVVNNEIIVLNAISGGCNISPALSLGATVDFDIAANWFLDEALTMPAGTFNEMTNTFSNTDETSGLPTTVYFSINDAVGGCSRTVSITITSNCPCLSVTRTWTGMTSTDWHTASNWNPACVPTASTDVKIPNVTNDPVINAAAVAKTVHVLSGGSLTINATKSLTINGSFPDAGNTQAMKNEGTVNNSGLLSIGSSTSSGEYGLLNLSTVYNNTGGEIAISNSTTTGLYNKTGVFSNIAAKITIGAVAGVGDVGLNNESTFNNNTGGEINIDNSNNAGLSNQSGTFTNAAKITIGSLAGVGDVGLINESTFNNNSGGEIYLDNSNNAGLSNQSGTFTNAAKITIGALTGVGDYGIYNFAIFQNNTGGEIAIDRSTFYGLFNYSAGTFTNAAKITIGAVAGIGSIGLMNQGNVNNNTGGEINIDNSSNVGIYHELGTFTNAAKIAVGALAGVGAYGVVNKDLFNNNTGGEISIDRSTGVGLDNVDGTFTNAAKITIGAVAGVGNYGLANQGAFNNNTGGEINIDNSSSVGLYHDFGAAFNNAAKITIGAISGVGVDGLKSYSTFDNNACAELRSFEKINNTSLGTITNAGLFMVSASGASINDGAFTNNGILHYPQGNPIPNVTNNEIVVAPETFNDCDAISPAFGLGNPVDFNILGVFSNAAATISAGTYNTATNTFTPNAELTEDTHQFYVKIQDGSGGCTRIVAWQLTTEDCCENPEAVCKAANAVLIGNSASLAASDVDNGSTADCGLLNMTVSPNTFDCSHIGTPQTVTLTVTDVRSNSSTCQTTVTVQDNTAPTITCPNPVTVTCAGQVPAVSLAAVTATDNCDTPAKSHVGDAVSGQTCTNRKTITRTYRATDNSGNSTTCAQVITVFDNVKPAFTSVPANVTVQCNSIPAVGTSSASDGCGGSVTITYNGQTITAGACTDTYVITRQWTAADACGNTQTATQRINVMDTQKPAFTTTPAHLTVQCDAVPAPVSPAATDNCDVSVAVTYNGQTQTNGACPNAYTITRTWTAADNCGNTKTVTQRITVVDNGKPVFTAFPGNTIIACSDAIPPVGSPTASDGCGSATVNYLGQTTTNGSCPGNYQIKRTWRATDACGNSTVATQTIQVVDNSVPVFVTVPGPVTIECGQPLPPLVNPTASDACGVAFVTFLGNVPSGSGCASNYTVTRTWEAEDLCGNTVTATQVITVLGNNYGEEGAENRTEDATELITHRSSLIAVFPNPTTDRIWIDLSGFANEPVTVSIFSDYGQLIWEKHPDAIDEQRISVSLREAGAAAGMYTVRVQSVNTVATKRVVRVE